MNFNLRKIKISDWEILFNWRNDDNTRYWFFNESVVDKESHIKYIKNIINSNHKEIYILFINDEPAGTINSNYNSSDDTYTLGYSIDNKFRKKGLSIIMMKLFLYDKQGTFICKIKETNIPSIKMVERVGYVKELLSIEPANILTYKLIK